MHHAYRYQQHTRRECLHSSHACAAQLMHNTEHGTSTAAASDDHQPICTGASTGATTAAAAARRGVEAAR